MSATAPSSAIATRTIRKISSRLLPFVFVLYIVAYLDRANVAFAKLTMTRDLGFSEAVFGLGAGIFFVGYFLLEIPGALIVERWSARWWISRILVTWGICTVLTGFIRSATEFYVARFVLGAAEAGFFPGIIIYLTHWYPAAWRARAMAGFVAAIPLSLLIGAPISGLLLQVNWFDLPGWRWVFIMEGLPAIILGFITPFVLTDRPQQASWLADEERDWLTRELELERRKKLAAAKVTAWQALRQPRVILLAFSLFFANIGVVGYLFWLPSTVQQASGLAPGAAAALSALPFAAGLISVVVFGRSSDRTGERVLHAGLPLVAAGLLFAATAGTGLPMAARMLLLCATGAAIYAFPPAFWVLPTQKLGESAAAASVGLINSIGNLGGFVGPAVVGWLLTDNQSLGTAVLFLSACFLAGGLLVLALGRSHSPTDPESGG